MSFSSLRRAGLGRVDPDGIRERRLTVLDRVDEPLWVKGFEKDLEASAYRAPTARRMILDDVDGDGETRTPCVFHPVARQLEGAPLIRFSGKGREEPRFTTGGRTRLRGKETSGP